MIVGWNVKCSAEKRREFGHRGMIVGFLRILYSNRRMYGWHVSRHWIREFWLKTIRGPAMEVSVQECLG